MGSVQSLAHQIWPEVKFTGGSDIHASIAWGAHLPKDPRKVFAILYKAKWATDVWRQLGHAFPNIEWLITQDQFECRAYVDFWQHAVGEGDTQHDSKLRNPSTGNVFHRVALYNETGLVCGIRFWCDVSGFSSDHTDFGFRFRIERLDEEEEDVRIRAHEQGVKDQEKLAEIEVELASNPDTAATEQETEETAKIREIEW